MEEARTRLFSRTARRGECRVWTGAKTGGGYGKIWFEGKLWNAHRLSYYLHYGEIPEGMDVCHTCDNPACVEPTHLWVGSRTDNMQDCATKGRNGSQRHPESRPRGADHWAQKRAGSMPTRGEANPHAKLTEQSVRALREAHRRGDNIAEMARDLGVSPPAAWAAIHRKTWRHVE